MTAGVRATVSVAGFTVLRGVVNFVLQAVVAAEFGAGPESDAYFVVVGSALLFVDLVIGVLTFTILPVLVRDRQQGEGVAVRRETVTLLWSGPALLITGAVLFATAPTVVELLAPGFSGATANFATDLFRFSLPGIVVYTYALIVGLGLQSRERFMSTAATPVLPLLGSLAAASLSSGPASLNDLMTGFTAGAGAAACGQLFLWRRLRRGPRARASAPEANLWTISRLVVPISIAFGAGALLPIVLRMSASELGAGSVAALGFAGQVVAIPIALLTTPVGTVLLPRMASLMPQGSFATGSRVLFEALLLVTLASALIGALMVGLADPMVELLYGRGSFTDRDAALTGDALTWLAVGIAAVSASSLLGRAFAAVGKVTPFAAVWVLTLVGFGTSWVVLRPTDVGGLAALYSGVLAVHVAALLALVRHYGAIVRVKDVAGVVLRLSISAGIAGVASRGLFSVVASAQSETDLAHAAFVSVSLAAGTGAFLLTTMSLRGIEASVLRSWAGRIHIRRR